MTDLNDAGRPAATVVIIRDRPDEAAELLMVERASTMAFAAGALVFPGGAVDPADLTLAARHGGDLALDEAAARIAAIRETIEEAGIAIGLAGPIDAAAVLRLRDGLHDGDILGDLLDRHGLTLALEFLTEFNGVIGEFARLAVFEERHFRLVADHRRGAVDAQDQTV